MMRAPIWVGASGTALVFMALAWFLPTVLGIEGRQLWILRGGLGVLGLVGAGLVARVIHLRSRPKRPRERDPDEERLEAVLAEARKRLAGAQGGARRLDNLPAILVLGPPASTKTTAVIQSGMQPELLAGEVYRGDVVVPTDSANLWYADGVVVAEASGELIEKAGRWRSLVEKLRPARLRAAFFRGRQAPRVALLCVGVDEFLKPGAARAIPELARSLRERLVEASQLLGIHLPVYVLFTRADRLPYFDEFTRNLSADEAAEILGATLPLRTFDSSSSYGDGQSRRLTEALEGIRRGLASKRLDLLPRESSEETRQAAYEFPRELGKLADPMQEFLMELCRPGHLGAGPFLRGFYLTGVRAVLVDDPSLHAAPTPEPRREAMDAGATGVFKAARAQMPESAPQAGRAGGPRKVPQWLFLRGVFQRVILDDGNAMGVTTSGSRVSLVRRLFLGAVTAAALVWLVGMTVSLVANRGVHAEVETALRGVEAPPPVQAGGAAGAEAAAGAAQGETPEGADGAPESVGVPEDLPVSYLRQLDALGEELDRLRSWEEGRPSLRYRWGLNRGSELLPPVRAAYFERFRELLWDDTRARVAGYLIALPPEPDEDSDYERTYNALKAHLMTTRHPEEAVSGFLTPALMTFGYPGVEDEETAGLLRAQFDRFARELRIDPPFDEPANETLVASTRDFLGEFAARDRFYQALVSGVSAELGMLSILDGDARARSALANDLQMPGAFTREGWRVVHDILDDPESLLVSEEWVVGEQVVSPEERVALAEELGVRYRQDYVRHWRELLATTSVRSFASINQAADALHVLSGNDSPIARVLERTSRNTAVDGDEVRRAFQPVHELVPPDGGEGGGSGAVRDYLDDLMVLQASLDQLQGATGARLEQGVIQGERDVGQVRTTIARLTRDFEREGEARIVGDQVERLLEQPAQFTAGLLGRYESTQAAGEINAEGRAFCSRFGDAVAGFPFAPGSTSDADIDEVKAFFQPGQSRLATFHDEVMDDLVVRQGGRWEARSGVSPAATGAFLSFYNQAFRVSDALFEASGEGPRVRFFLRVEASERVPEVEVQVDGQSQVYTRTQAPTRDFVWEGERAQTARLVAQVDGSSVTVAEGSGPWGVFRLFGGADRWEDLGGGTHRVTWSVPGAGTQVSAEINFAGTGVPVFRSAVLAAPTCVSEIVR